MNDIPSLIFIVPYRNRELEKIHYSIYINYLLEDCKFHYEIYYSEQHEDNRPFNRGAVKNIGFLAIKDKYPNNYRDITFVFNDIDTLPFKKNKINYLTSSGLVKHYYGYKYTLGGIFSIVGSDFEKIGGFPNLWGWGLEDNIIQKKIEKTDITIDRSQFYPIKSREFININSGQYKTMNRSEIDMVFKNNYDDMYGISNLNYNIITEESDSNYYKLKNQYTIKINNFIILNSKNIDPNKFFKKDINVSNTISPSFSKYKAPTIGMNFYNNKTNQRR